MINAFFGFFETEFLYVTLFVLELTQENKLAGTSQRSACFWFSSVGIKGVSHHRSFEHQPKHLFAHFTLIFNIDFLGYINNVKIIALEFIMESLVLHNNNIIYHFITKFTD